jgi:fructosamine-3-kinase
MPLPRDHLVNLLEAAGIAGPVARVTELSGGCIHRVMKVEVRGGCTVVVKTSAAAGSLQQFEAEAAGLRALHATATVPVPHPLAAVEHRGIAALVLEYLAPAPRAVDDEAWSTFGRELAALHAAFAGDQYGFAHDNHLGSTPQPNGWMDDWVEFNRARRLGHQLRLARDAGLLHSDEAAIIERVIRDLDRLLPRRPRPSLLHGDLWSGNALATTDAEGSVRIALIDPACSIGDGWADIAMMRLFGGFPQACFEAHAARAAEGSAPMPHGAGGPELTARIAVYQLYHVLNHVNLFGRGYVAQAMSLAALLREIARRTTNM